MQRYYQASSAPGKFQRPTMTLGNASSETTNNVAGRRRPKSAGCRTVASTAASSTEPRRTCPAAPVRPRPGWEDKQPDSATADLNLSRDRKTVTFRDDYTQEVRHCFTPLAIAVFLLYVLQETFYPFHFCNNFVSCFFIIFARFKLQEIGNKM